MTLTEAFSRGIYRLRRATWGPNLWLELVDAGGFLSPFGQLHSALEGDDIPVHLYLPALEVPIYLLAPEGWLPYEYEWRGMMRGDTAQGRPDGNTGGV